VTHRAHEIRFSPLADSRLGIRRDVRSIKFSERRFEFAPAGVRHGVFLVFGMAGHAAAGLRKIQAALHVAAVGACALQGRHA
jgi:hypothetical protein